MSSTRLVLTLLSLCHIAAGQSQKTPTFERFPIARVNSGRTVGPSLGSEKDPIRREKIKEGAKAGINFAGYCTIAEWECGPACRAMALIDTTNGKVYPGPFEKLGSLTGFLYEGKFRLEHRTATQLTYKMHSRLLVVRGCPENNEQECATYFYEWAGFRFKLITTVPATPAARL